MSTDELRLREEKVLSALKEAGIPYDYLRHVPVFTMEDVAEMDVEPGVVYPKNLFLVSKNGPERKFLVLVQCDKKVRTRDLGRCLGSRNPGFGTAEELWEALGLTPGAVSPFGLVNDAAGKVELVVDEALLQLPKLAFHPNVNDATITLRREDLLRFFALTAHTPRVLCVPGTLPEATTTVCEE